MRNEDIESLKREILESEPIEHLMEFEGFKKFEEELERMLVEIQIKLLSGKPQSSIDEEAMALANSKGKAEAITQIKGWFDMHQQRAMSAREALKDIKG